MANIKFNGPVTMTANTNAGGFKVTNLAAGTADTDAVTVKQLNDATGAHGNYLPLSGGTMTGALNLPAVPDVTAAADTQALPKAAVQALISDALEGPSGDPLYLKLAGGTMEQGAKVTWGADGPGFSYDAETDTFTIG